jgi:hypothetical protein
MRRGSHELGVLSKDSSILFYDSPSPLEVLLSFNESGDDQEG